MKLSKQSHILFDSYIGRRKPETIVKRENHCPFCDRDSLENIIDSDGSIILLKNKFPVLHDTLQTVLIETDQCQSDLSVYPKAHLHRLLHFGIKHWLEFMNSKEFTSVAFFRNYGPFSGGSIAHPHSQIVGFHQYDYKENVQERDFVGLLIDKNSSASINVSTHPRVGFYEFNVILEDQSSIDYFADYIQIAAHYILHHFIYKCNSYNVFFYYHYDRIIAKIIPRYATSPLYIGYAIPQVPNNLEEVVADLKSKYLR